MKFSVTFWFINEQNNPSNIGVSLVLFYTSKTCFYLDFGKYPLSFYPLFNITNPLLFLNFTSTS